MLMAIKEKSNEGILVDSLLQETLAGKFSRERLANLSQALREAIEEAGLTPQEEFVAWTRFNECFYRRIKWSKNI